MTYRVIVGPPRIGRAAIEGVLGHPDLELAGCWVHSAAKAGQDVGTLVRREPIGVRATADEDEVLALDADCVVYAAAADPPTVARILRSGKNVVTPVGWWYRRSGPERIEACQEGGTTLHGTGIHPGGITERFPLMVSALSGSIRSVRAEEWSDIRTCGGRRGAGHHVVRRHPGGCEAAS